MYCQLCAIIFSIQIYRQKFLQDEKIYTLNANILNLGIYFKEIK